MDNPWQLCRTIGPLTLHSQETGQAKSIQDLFKSVAHIFIHENATPCDPEI